LAKRIAISAGSRVQVWDAASAGWELMTDLPEQDLAIAVAISPGGTLVAHASREEIVVSEVPTGKRRLSVPFKGCARMAFHPSEKWIAVCGKAFGLVALDEEPHFRDLYLGGKSIANPLSEIFRAKLGAVDLEEMTRLTHANVEKTIEQMRRASIRSKKHLLSEEQFAAMQREMEKGVAEMQSRWRQFQEGREPIGPPQGQERVRCVGFSRAGDWFWCGTDIGLKVYDWSAVPRAAGSDMPPAAWKFALPQELVTAAFSEPGAAFEGFNSVAAVAEEADAKAIAFGVVMGRLYRLDLETGEQRELSSMPGDSRIHGLMMSLDGQTLATVTSRGRSLKDHRSAWQISSYPRLRGPFLQTNREAED
jgi:hypothetical protein